MPDPLGLEHHDTAAPAAGEQHKDAKKQNRANLAIAAGTFGVLIVTWMIYKSSAKGKTGSSSTTAGGTSGTVAGAAGGQGDPYTGQYLQQIAEQINSSLASNQQAQADAQAGFMSYLDTLTQHLVDTNTPAPPSTPTSPPPASSTAPGSAFPAVGAFFAPPVQGVATIGTQTTSGWQTGPTPNTSGIIQSYQDASGQNYWRDLGAQMGQPIGH